MEAKFGKAFAAPLLLVNFALYVILLGLSGWALNEYLDAPGSPTTYTLVMFSLITGTVGVASVLAGLHHLKKWTPETYASAGASAFIAWLLSILSFGLAWKHIHVGHAHGRRLKALESLAIIVTGTQLIYVVALHHKEYLFFWKPKGYVPTGSAAGEPTEKTPAAAAV